MYIVSGIIICVFWLMVRIPAFILIDQGGGGDRNISNFTAKLCYIIRIVNRPMIETCTIALLLSLFALLTHWTGKDESKL